MKPYVGLAYVGQFGEEMDFHTDAIIVLLFNIFHLIFTRLQKGSVTIDRFGFVYVSLYHTLYRETCLLAQY